MYGLNMILSIPPLFFEILRSAQDDNMEVQDDIMVITLSM